jgi:putative endopeptidase
MKKLFLAAASAAALSLATGPALAQQPAAKAPAAAAPAKSLQPKRLGKWGVDLTARDTKVKPGDSFFDYANGTWLKTVQFDADLPVAGVSVDNFKLVQDQLRAVIDESAAKPTTPTAQKVGDLYKSFMDEARLEQLDDKPLQADLNAVKAVKTHSDMARLMGESVYGFGSAILSLSVGLDAKNPNAYAVSANVGGMTLPDRDYYLLPQYAAQKAAYQAYMGRTLKLAGWAEPEKLAADVVAMETRLAESVWTRVERRDPNKTYNPMSLAELKKLTPEFDWDAYLRGVNGPVIDRVIVGQNTAFPKVSKVIAETPIETLKAWQAFRITHQASPYLSKRFVDNQFEFSKVLSGQQQQLPRWRRGVGNVDATLGEALGREYVTRYFPAASKAEMEKLVANLHKAMRGRIEKADWMSPSTRAEALKKLQMQRVKIGYPTKWRSYDALTIDPTDLYGNIERSSAFEAKYAQARLARPVDRDEWFMTPQTINAYFNPVGNEIVFPAAYLQPPAFDPKADMAVNYGAIGAVIGHEISHGFDDQGRQYDSSGVLRDWWAPQDAERFKGEAARLVTQFGAYEALPGAKVNGQLTLGENIGDQGGLLVAYDAYKAALGGKKAPVIDGLTGDQRFFLGWAQNWRNKYRDQLIPMILASDVHAPDRFRVDGALRNIDAWYTAFDVKPGDKLYLPPDQRVRVW